MTTINEKYRDKISIELKKLIRESAAGHNYPSFEEGLRYFAVEILPEVLSNPSKYSLSPVGQGQKDEEIKIGDTVWCREQESKVINIREKNGKTCYDFADGGYCYTGECKKISATGKDEGLEKEAEEKYPFPDHFGTPDFYYSDEYSDIMDKRRRYIDTQGKEWELEQEAKGCADMEFGEFKQLDDQYDRGGWTGVYTGYLAAARQYAPVTQWVSIDEKLPEQSGEVLGCMKDTLSMYICFYKKDRKLFQVYGAGVDPYSDMKVTHWQPLPSPPRPSKETDTKK